MFVTVFGLAKSGIAAAKRLAGSGKKVLVTESQPKEKFDPVVITELAGLGIELEFGGHSDKVLQSELIVVSPGVPLTIPVLRAAREKNIEIISEIELGYRLLTKPIIAITGTNGKTTTTTLIGEMLKSGGKRVAVAGNIGEPLVGVDDANLDYVVAEVSSYQLETIVHFKPFISLILNLQEDHLARHGTMEEYARIKSRIFANQTGDDYLIFNADDKWASEMSKNAKCRTVPFSKVQAGIITLNPDEIRIPGRHNLENALAAAQAAYLCGVSKEVVARVLKEFPGVEHRIEFVRRLKGIDFYNDSKGTNPDSTLVAIEAFPGRGIVLLLGGRDKGVNLEPLVRSVKRSVRKVVLLGEAADRFESALKMGGFAEYVRADSFSDAVNKAYSLARENDLVLLSPACASFDMFQNYEERGRVFKELVNKL